MPENNPYRTTISFLKRGLLSLALIISLGAIANSQISRFSLRLRVTDQLGEAVAGETVDITNAVTNQTMTAVTSGDGTVVFNNLEPGTYKIAVSASGFAPFEESIPLTSNLTKDVILMFGGLKQVTAAAVAGAGQPISISITAESEQDSLSSLPNQNNDLSPLLQVAPGALPLGSSALGLIVVDGKGLDQQTARLDGADFTIMAGLPSADSAIDPTSSFTLPAVAGNVSASQIRTGAFEARYGPGSAVADTTTYTAFGKDKDKWTAEFYGEHRNDVLNARNFFDVEGKNALRRTRFGGKGGRALDPDARSVIFVAYDGIRGRVERPVYEAVPIDSMCCPAQPFTQLFHSYVPAGTAIVTGASQDPDFLVARRRGRTSVNSNAFDVRYEYSPFITAKDPDGKAAVKAGDVLTLRFTRQGTENLVPDGITARQQRQNILFNNILANFKFFTSLDTTHTIRFGFNSVRAKVANEIPPDADPSLSASMLNVSGTISAKGLPGELTSVPVASLGTVVKGSGRGFRLAPASFNLAYDMETRIGKKYVFNAGAEGRLIRIGVDRLGGLTYSYPNIAALRNGTPASVSYQSDLSAASPFTTGTGPRQARQQYVMGYMQLLTNIGEPSPDPTLKGDKISRLRITFGYRYDYFSPVRERDGRAVVVDPLTGNILPPGTRFYSTRTFNFQPRASLIYRFADAGVFSNTVFSGGAGIYAGTARIADYLLPIDSDRFSTAMSALLFPVDPSILRSNFLTHADTRQFQPLTFARDFVAVERVYKWEAKLSQTIKGYDVSAFYSGNEGRNLPVANIANKITHVFTNPDPTKPAVVQREFDLESNGLLFKPFGEFFYRTSEGRSSYDALTITFQRNAKARPVPDNSWLVSAVASLNAQYILSRSVGNASGTIMSNPFDLNSDLGDNLGIPRHFFKLSAVYELWRGKTGSSPTKSLLSWKIMPVLKVSSGLPLIVRLNRPDVVYVDGAGLVFSSPALGRTAIINTPGGGESGAARIPNLVAGVNPYLRNDRQFLNPAAFSIPAPGQFGDIRRGSLHGPKIVQLDLGLRRNLFETEKRASAQFQIDIFNVFNRTNFFNPTAALPGRLGTNGLNGDIQPGVPLNRAAAGGFGVLTSADAGRVIQLSFTLRLNDGFTSYRVRD